MIGADTVVSIEGEILGKPKDWRDAKRMLLRLSGRAHQVYTGVCVIDAKSGRAACRSERTDVLFRKLTKRQIRAYIKTREPMDKAWRLCDTGRCRESLSAAMSGSFDNVVGLPVKLVRELIETEFT